MKNLIKKVILAVWTWLVLKPRIGFLRLFGAKVGKGCKILTSLSNMDLQYLSFLTIGDDVTIAKNVLIFVHDGATTRMKKWWNIEKEQFRPVKIGNHVFIGAGAIILPGVTLGNHVIVGAGSLVNKSFPDNVIIGGNPAQILKQI